MNKKKMIIYQLIQLKNMKMIKINKIIKKTRQKILTMVQNHKMKIKKLIMNLIIMMMKRIIQVMKVMEIKTIVHCTVNKTKKTNNKKIKPT